MRFPRKEDLADALWLKIEEFVVEQYHAQIIVETFIELMDLWGWDEDDKIEVLKGAKYRLEDGEATFVLQEEIDHLTTYYGL